MSRKIRSNFRARKPGKAHSLWRAMKNAAYYWNERKNRNQDELKRSAEARRAAKDALEFASQERSRKAYQREEMALRGVRGYHGYGKRCGLRYDHVHATILNFA